MKKKKSKIREIIEKHVDSFGIIVPEDFDELEKELRDLIEWNYVGNNMIQIGNKFYKLTGTKRDLQKDKEKK